MLRAAHFTITLGSKMTYNFIKALLPTDAQENYFKSTITIYFKAQAQIVRSLMMVIIPKHVGGILM